MINANTLTNQHILNLEICTIGLLLYSKYLSYFKLTGDKKKNSK